MLIHCKKKSVETGCITCSHTHTASRIDILILTTRTTFLFCYLCPFDNWRGHAVFWSFPTSFSHAVLSLYSKNKKKSSVFVELTYMK